MNYLERSKKQLASSLKENPNITEDEWNRYAHINYLYNSITLESHLLTDEELLSDIDKFMLLKNKLMPFFKRKWWY